MAPVSINTQAFLDWQTDSEFQTPQQLQDHADTINEACNMQRRQQALLEDACCLSLTFS